MTGYLPDVGEDLTTSDIRDILDVDETNVPGGPVALLRTLLFVLVELDELTGRSDLKKREVLQQLVGAITAVEQLFDHTVSVTYDREKIETTVATPDSPSRAHAATSRTRDEFVAALEAVTEALLAREQSPPVETRIDINNGYQRYFAEAVYDRLGEPENVEVLQLPVGMGEQHICLEYEGLYFDAEAPDGVDEPTKLPIFDDRLVAPDDDIEPVLISGTYVTLK
jgi:hypothetical protein